MLLLRTMAHHESANSAMTNSSRPLGVVAVTIASLLLLASGPPRKDSKQAQKNVTAQSPAATASSAEKGMTVLDRSTAASEYAGNDTCRTCHEDLGKLYDRGPHWKTLQNHRGPQFQGCEGCHGPGKAHAESGGDVTRIIRFKSISREQSSRICLDCHQFGEEHANFLRSEHLKNQVGCIDCHSSHHPKVERALLVMAQPMLCYGCHAEIKPQFSKPTHHRVNEGLISCSNCHNPHGGFINRQLRATAAQDQVCFTCHTDKAGPFVFEHPPVKTEGCLSCHQPHGSSNPHLLTRAQVNTMCLECHTLTVIPSENSAPGVPTFHNQAQKYQACTMCHVAVHGSNSDKDFFRF
jgi:DmsE family decaheme c-type cytochrome